MRPADVIHAQIRWDPRLDARRFTLGIDEHRAQPKILAFDRFVPDGEIPWHRVLFFAFDGQPCWDRRSGIDQVDGLAEGATTAEIRLGPPWSGRSPVRFADGRWNADAHQPGPSLLGSVDVLTWNVLWDRFDADRIDSDARWPLLIETILTTDAQIVCLQEVDPAFHRLLLGHPLVRADWWLSHGPRHPEVGARDLLILGRVAVAGVAMLAYDDHKGALAAILPGERPVVVVTTHLSSNHREGAAGIRARELTQLFAGLADVDHPVVVTGDFNLRDEAPIGDLRDAWRTLHDAAPTFVPADNPLAALASRSGLSGRLDRVLVRGDATPVAIERLGTAPVDGRWLSDHYGLRARVALGDGPDTWDGEPSVRSALAWVPADPLPAVQEVRRRHDPAFRRWPPHVNVLWGFAPEAEIPVAAGLVADALADLAPFPTVLDRADGFGRGRGRTHHLAPGEVEPWRDLHRPLAETFPTTVRHPRFQPHLTVARGPAPEGLVDLLPLGDVVGELVWMTRRGRGPFAVRARFPLGTGTWIRVAEPSPPGLDRDVDAAIDGVIEQLREVLPDGRLVVVGSRALGVGHGRSDLDLVLEADGAVVDTVCAALETLAPSWLVVVEKNGLPGIQLELDRIAIDLAVLGPDDTSLAAARMRSAETDAAALRTSLGDRLALVREVKRWAMTWHLDDPALGGLEGLAWAVLVDGCEATTLAGFVEHWAAHDWSLPVNGARDDVAQITVVTPTAPLRNITTRAVRWRLERALLASWEALETGRLPVPWHQRCGWAVHVGSDDRSVRSALRGRTRAVLEAYPAFDPLPVGDGVALGVPDASARETAVRTVRSVLRGLHGLEVRWVATEVVD